MRFRPLISILLTLVTFSIKAQTVKIITDQNSLMSGYQDLLAGIDKRVLPEGYEYILWAPNFIPVDGNVGYVKVALPKNILSSNATTDYKLYSSSIIKTSLFKLNIHDVNGYSTAIEKNTFLLSGSIQIAPPTKCYISFDEYKKDKTFKTLGPEGIPRAITEFKYVDTQKGELKKQGYIVVGIDQLHCGTASYGPWVDLRANNKPIYCAIDFNFKCAAADELEIIKNYTPYSANYLTQMYTNPGGRDILNEIRPDGSSAVFGSKEEGIPIDIFNDLEGIEKYENSKETMHNLFNRVTGQAMVSSIISLAAMHEIFEADRVCGAGRQAALVSYVKSKVTQNYEQIQAIVEESIKVYTSIIPCGRYFFDPALVKTNTEEFNAVIKEINSFCNAAFRLYQREGTYFTSSQKTSVTGDLSNLDRGLAGYVNFSQNAPKDISALNEAANKVAKQNLPGAEYLLQKLMSTTYFKFFYADSFANYVNKFDIDKCVKGDSIISAQTMNPIPVGETLLLKTASKELIATATESLNDLVKTKKEIISSTDIDQEKSYHEDRKEALVDYLLSYTLAFKQYKSMMLPSSREYLLSTKLIGEVYKNDQSRANWNKALGIGASIIAVAGAILAITGIGAPAGSVLASISAAINSYTVLAATTAVLMTNEGVNWEKAVTEIEYSKTAAATLLREEDPNYKSNITAERNKDSAISDLITNFAFLALPVGIQVAVKDFYPSVRQYTYIKAALADEKLAGTYGKFMSDLKAAGVTPETKGFDELMQIMNSKKATYSKINDKLSIVLNNAGVDDLKKSKQLLEPFVKKDIIKAPGKVTTKEQSKLDTKKIAAEGSKNIIPEVSDVDALSNFRLKLTKQNRIQQTEEFNNHLKELPQLGENQVARGMIITDAKDIFNITENGLEISKVRIPRREFDVGGFGAGGTSCSYDICAIKDPIAAAQYGFERLGSSKNGGTILVMYLEESIQTEKGLARTIFTKRGEAYLSGYDVPAQAISKQYLYKPGVGFVEVKIDPVTRSITEYQKVTTY